MWFLNKIHYKVQDNLGKWKSFSEQFIQEGITYAEVENQMYEFLEGRVTDYEYDISKIKFGSVYEPFNKGSFYKVTIEEKTQNDAGVDKITVLTHYVIANDVTEAERRASDYIKGWVTDTTIVGAVKSKILGVWHPHNQQWQDDFKERMLALAEAGNESSDANQTTLFDKEGNPKKYGEDETTDPNDNGLPFGDPATGFKKTKKIRGVNITFHKQNGDPVEA